MDDSSRRPTQCNLSPVRGLLFRTAWVVDQYADGSRLYVRPPFLICDLTGPWTGAELRIRHDLSPPSVRYGLRIYETDKQKKNERRAAMA
ncbi:hypothetical protein Trydic_g2767 [Trypoxylus dichotomus]